MIFHSFWRVLRVRRHLEENNGSVKQIFLPLYSPFLNPTEYLWRNGRAEIRWTFRRRTKSYFRRKTMPVYESLEITFDPRYTLFRNLNKILPE